MGVKPDILSEAEGLSNQNDLRIALDRQPHPVLLPAAGST